MTRLIIGKEIFSISPNETKSVKLKPGRIHYIAITPGIIPTAGFQLFESNNEYKWEF